MSHESFLIIQENTIYGYAAIPAEKNNKIIGFVIINQRISRAILMWSLEVSSTLVPFFGSIPYFGSLLATSKAERSLIDVFNATRIIVQDIDYNFDERILQLIRIQSLTSYSKTALEGINILTQFLGRSSDAVIRQFLHNSVRDILNPYKRRNFFDDLKQSPILGALFIHQEDAEWFLQRIPR